MKASDIDNDDWIEWGGGVRPIKGDVVVDIKFLNGVMRAEQLAEKVRWSNMGQPDDIIAYRVIENDGREG